MHTKRNRVVRKLTTKESTDIKAGSALVNCSGPAHPVPQPVSSSVSPSLAIRTSEKGGLGCFATVEIATGTLILSETPLLTANNASVANAYAELPQPQKAVYRALASYDALHPNKVVSIFRTNRLARLSPPSYHFMRAILYRRCPFE